MSDFSPKFNLLDVAAMTSDQIRDAQKIIDNKTFDLAQRVNANTEHFIERFLADTGARIEDCELCQQNDNGVIRIWVRRRDSVNKDSNGGSFFGYGNSLEPRYSMPPTDAYINKLEPGEPHFLLMGRDPKAPHCVRRWAVREIEESDSPSEKAQAAFNIANAMEVWRAARNPGEPGAE